MLRALTSEVVSTSEDGDSTVSLGNCSNATYMLLCKYSKVRIEHDFSENISKTIGSSEIKLITLKLQ